MSKKIDGYKKEKYKSVFETTGTLIKPISKTKYNSVFKTINNSARLNKKTKYKSIFDKQDPLIECNGTALETLDKLVKPNIKTKYKSIFETLSHMIESNNKSEEKPNNREIEKPKIIPTIHIPKKTKHNESSNSESSPENSTSEDVSEETNNSDNCLDTLKTINTNIITGLKKKHKHYSESEISEIPEEEDNELCYTNLLEKYNINCHGDKNGTNIMKYMGSIKMCITIMESLKSNISSLQVVIYGADTLHNEMITDMVNIIIGMLDDLIYVINTSNDKFLLSLRRTITEMKTFFMAYGTMTDQNIVFDKLILYVEQLDDLICITKAYKEIAVKHKLNQIYN